MYSIILKKDGFTKKEWNGDKREYEYETVPVDLDLFAYWRSGIEIEGPVTLMDLVNILKSADPFFLSLIELLTQSSIEPFIKEIENEVEDKTDDLAAIEITKYYELNEYDDGSKHANEVVSCDGRYKTPYVDPQFPEHEHKTCAIEFTHWNVLKDLPIEINTMATVTTWKVKTKEYKMLEDYEVWISLGEFFDGLTDELCFFGSPSRRDGENQNLKDIMKRIDDGTEKLIPWEEVKERLDKKMEEFNEDNEGD